MLTFSILQKQIRPAWRAIIIFRSAVRGGPCEPRRLGASTDPAHGPWLRAPGAGADTILVLGVKMGGLESRQTMTPPGGPVFFFRPAAACGAC
jgi:hypothetical protein